MAQNQKREQQKPTENGKQWHFQQHLPGKLLDLKSKVEDFASAFPTVGA